MGSFNPGKKFKSILEVLSSHFFVLFITMLISLILPLRISVAEYGKWQLFTLIIGYAGFFALGFNDGIHVNYSGLDYNDELFYKFRLFRIIIDCISIIGTIITIIIILFFRQLFEDRFLLLIIASFNIIPVLLNGFFAYVNQGSMRFSVYAKANLLEKLIYIALMAVLLVIGVKNALYYCLFYTISRYCVVVYNSFKCKELYGKPHESFDSMKSEIRNNFVIGFSLMLAVLCNQSILVPGRLLIENEYGIVAFSCYSFAINTMVIANQVTTALSQVFFPAMKRAGSREFSSIFITLDKAIGLLAILLLFSYYPVYILIKHFYPEYVAVLDYLYCIYPLFVYSSKSAILVINTYKLDSDGKRLLINNAAGVLINLVAVVIAHFVFQNVFFIALFSLLGYMIWYYCCYSFILRNKGIPFRLSCFLDAFVVLVFILINGYTINYVNSNALIVSLSLLLLFVVIFCFSSRKYLSDAIHSFLDFMKD